MIRTNGNWMKIQYEEQMKSVAKGHRVQHATWSGPGWYYVERYEQKCPRGCCYDDVIRFSTAAERAEEVADGMKELACELRHARTRIVAQSSE